MRSPAFLAIMISVGAAAACAAGPDTEGAGGAGTTTTTTTTTTTSTTMVVCSEQPSDVCFTCCGDSHHDGLGVLNEAIVTHCGCEPAAVCEVACDTTDGATDVCLDGGQLNADAVALNKACTDCLTGLTREDACVVQSGTDCAAEVDCKAYMKCADICPVE